MAACGQPYYSCCRSSSFPIREAPDLTITTSVILLGAICTGLAYLLCVASSLNSAHPSALSVTFLVPVFGILWGSLFLDEAIGINTIVGSILVITGTMLVTGLSPVQMIKNARQKRKRKSGISRYETASF